MEKWEIEVKEHWNKISDSEWYQSLRTDDRLSALYNNPETAFHPEMLSLMKKYIGNFTGKRILLPSSGDNHAAFAFALMGAKVTSADISERQLENAKSISDSWGLNIEYVCDNTRYLSKIDAAAYDLVYTYDELKSLKTEEHATINDWKCNPMAAIPAWIGIVSQK